jgi:hypothetical protein
MRDIVLSKRLGDGRLVEVEVQEYAIGRYRCLVYVAGKWVDGPEQPLPLPMPRADFTHYLGGKAAGPIVGLTAPEAEVISAELLRRKSAVDGVANQTGSRPGGRYRSLYPAA